MDEIVRETFLWLRRRMLQLFELEQDVGDRRRFGVGCEPELVGRHP